MRRKAVAWVMLAALGGLGGCASGPETGGGFQAHNGRGMPPPVVPGVVGPYGQPVTMAAPYDAAPPASKFQAQRMMAQSVPLDMVQMSSCNGAACGVGPAGASMPPTIFPRGGVLSPPGVPFAPGMSAGPAVTPASYMNNPANAGGVMNANIPAGMMPPGGVVQTQMAQAGPGANHGFHGVRFQSQRTQVRFTRPSGMKIAWYTQGPDGKPMYSTTPIEAPGRYNFAQAAIYRLKLSNIEGRPGLEVYPTMEVVPSNPKTEGFLAHSAVPVEFTAEDFKQIAEGNYVIKVIYLPDPQFQDLAGTGTDEILSTRLEPGADPIQEALRRGSILLVIRMGNVDQEAPNTPALNTPGPNMPVIMPPQGGPNLKGGFQVPYYGMPKMPGGAPMVPGHGLPPNVPGAPQPGAVNIPNGVIPSPGGSFITPPQGPNGFTAPQGPLSIPNVPSVPLTTVPNPPSVPGGVNNLQPAAPSAPRTAETPGAPAFPPSVPGVSPSLPSPPPLPPTSTGRTPGDIR